MLNDKMKILFRNPFKNESEKVKPIWKQYYEIVKLFFALDLVPFEYYCFKFHHKDCTEKKILEFIPYSWFLYKVNVNMTPRSWMSLFNNKLLFNEYAKLKGIKVPKDFGVYNSVYGYDLIDNTNLCNAEDLEKFFRKHLFKQLVIKDIKGTQGKNIHFIDDINYSGNSIELTIDNTKMSSNELTKLLGSGEYLFEELLENSPFFRKISPNTLNTIRVVTFLNKSNQVKIANGFARVGVGKSKVDNWHAGGLKIPLNFNEGIMVDYAYDYACNIYEKHSETNFIFRNAIVPDLDKLIKRVKEYALLFPMQRFIAWDFAFTNKGLIVIEVNIKKTNFDQLSNRGLASLLREDLREFGYDFPEEKIPTVTPKVVIKKIIAVSKRLIHG